MLHRTCLVSALVLPTLAGAGAAQQNGNAQAHAEAHASAQGGECRTSTHRVVVVDGKTVVDERTENGKPVGKPGGNGPAPMPPRPPMPQLGGVSVEEMLRRMQEEVRRQLEQQDRQRATPPVPLKPATPPPPPPPTGQRPPPRRA